MSRSSFVSSNGGEVSAEVSVSLLCLSSLIASVHVLFLISYLLCPIFGLVGCG